VIGLKENPKQPLRGRKGDDSSAKWLTKNKMQTAQKRSKNLYLVVICPVRITHVIANSMTGTFEYDKRHKRDVP